ncbi:MAG TPA: ATP synthase F0 subunit C [Planctomycetota bacterium]|nr:ATP synthase F0 subunit C [Planctomycetota bacterium]
MQETVALILVLLIVSLGPSFVIAMVGYASIQALGRNPSAAPKIQMAMIIAFIFAVAIAFASLLVVFNLFVPKTGG